MIVTVNIIYVFDIDCVSRVSPLLFFNVLNNTVLLLELTMKNDCLPSSRCRSYYNHTRGAGWHGLEPFNSCLGQSITSN